MVMEFYEELLRRNVTILFWISMMDIRYDYGRL